MSTGGRCQGDSQVKEERHRAEQASGGEERETEAGITPCFTKLNVVGSVEIRGYDEMGAEFKSSGVWQSNRAHGS